MQFKMGKRNELEMSVKRGNIPSRRAFRNKNRHLMIFPVKRDTTHSGCSHVIHYCKFAIATNKCTHFRHMWANITFREGSFEISQLKCLNAFVLGCEGTHSARGKYFPYDYSMPEAKVCVGVRVSNLRVYRIKRCRNAAEKVDSNFSSTHYAANIQRPPVAQCRHD